MKKAISNFLTLGCAALLTFTSFLATAAPPIQVTAADPSSSTQGTLSLDVAVSGSGFDGSAVVDFLVTGTTNPGGIAVKKVNVVGPKKLIATIDIADTAAIASFDIQVTQSGGRKGKGTTLFSVLAKQTGKPAPEPEPLPPPGSCSGAPGVFPAFVYGKTRSHTEKNKWRQVYDGTDTYIANSTGSCSVKLLINDGGGSYRQIGNDAVMAWSTGSAIKLLRLPIVNGNVIPIRPVIVYSNDSASYGMAGAQLSKDGRTIYFWDTYSPVEGHWQDTVKSIDITSCTANCAPRVVYTLPIDVGLAGLSINDAEDRLYMTLGDRVLNVKTVSFLQKQAGVWTALRHVVSNLDFAYSSVRGFWSPAAGRWDYQNSSVAKDVLAFVVENLSGLAIDIIDVSNCSATGTQSCYGSGEGTLVRTGIAGRDVSFTSMPASSDPGPNLLISDGDGDWRTANETVKEVDPDSMTVTPLLEGHTPESAD